MSDLWATASADVEQENLTRHVTSARVAAASVWPFLAAAVNERDYANRKGLAADKIERIAAAQADGDPALFSVLHASLLEEFDRDFAVLHTERLAARVAEQIKTRQQREAEDRLRVRLEAHIAARIARQQEAEMAQLLAVRDSEGAREAAREAAVDTGPGKPKGTLTWQCEDCKHRFDSSVLHGAPKCPKCGGYGSRTNKRPHDAPKAARKTASTYCPNHGVYVGEGNQEQHDHCKTEQRETKDSAKTADADGSIFCGACNGQGVRRDFGGSYVNCTKCKGTGIKAGPRKKIDRDLGEDFLGDHTGTKTAADAEVDEAGETIQQWLCGKCGHRNDIDTDLCDQCGAKDDEDSQHVGRRKTAGENPFANKSNTGADDSANSGAKPEDPNKPNDQTWQCPNCQATDAYTQGGKNLDEALKNGEPIQCGSCQQVDNSASTPPATVNPPQQPGTNPAQAAKTASPWEHGLGEGEGQVYSCLLSMGCDFVGTAAEMQAHYATEHLDSINRDLLRQGSRGRRPFVREAAPHDEDFYDNSEEFQEGYEAGQEDQTRGKGYGDAWHDEDGPKRRVSEEWERGYQRGFYSQGSRQQASKTAAEDMECPDCGGTGAVPAGGGPMEDVDNGYARCGTCDGTGRVPFSTYPGDRTFESSKTAANPYTPTANPYVNDPPAQQMPDDLLDGPQTPTNPLATNVPPPMTTRPRQQPNGAPADNATRQGFASLVPVVCGGCGTSGAAPMERIASLSCPTCKTAEHLDLDDERYNVTEDEKPCMGKGEHIFTQRHSGADCPAEPRYTPKKAPRSASLDPDMPMGLLPNDQPEMKTLDGDPRPDKVAVPQGSAPYSQNALTHQQTVRGAKQAAEEKVYFRCQQCQTRGSDTRDRWRQGSTTCGSCRAGQKDLLAVESKQAGIDGETGETFTRGEGTTCDAGDCTNPAVKDGKCEAHLPRDTSTATAAKVAQITAAILESNPGMAPPTARRIAVKTVRRYPKVAS